MASADGTSAALRAMGHAVPARIEDVTAAIKAKLIGGGLSRVLGRYEIVRVLGSGGQGLVYEGRDPALERPVAIKVLRTKRDDDRDPHGRLRREARVLAQLDHPNIVRVFDVGEHDDDGTREIHVVMEYVDGTNLGRWLAEDRTVDEVLDKFAAAARGLAEAHRAGIVHRDFKPGNVLIGGDGNPRVADFGLATGDDAIELAWPSDRAPSFDAERSDHHDDLTLTGDVLGTPRYMAPEQLRGEPIGPRADQYAWCVALYRALWNEEPFDAHDLRGLLAAKAAGPRAPPDRRPVPRGVWPVLARGMAPVAGDRHESFDALLDELARARIVRPRRGLAFATLGGALVGLSLAASVGAKDACDDADDLDVWTAADRETWRASPAGRLATEEDDPFAVQMDVYRRQFHAVKDELCEGESYDAPTRALVLDCLGVHAEQAEALVRDVAELPAELGPFTELAGTLRAAEDCRDPHYRARVARGTLVRDSSREFEAIAYIRLGRLEEARSVAREILREDDGLERETVAWSVLGAAAAAEGDFVAADEWYQATYFRCATLANHGGAANAAAHLTGIHIGLGRADQVAIWAKNAEIELARAGGDPVIDSILQNNLGEAALWRGEYEQAREHYERATDVLSGLHGPDAETVQVTRNNLALTLERTGDLEGALALHEQLLASRRAHYGSSHIDVYVSALNLANLLYRLGALEEARTHSRTALVAAIGSIGEDSVQADFARLMIAQIDVVIGDDDRIAEADALIARVRPAETEVIERGLVAMQREFLLGWQARRDGDLPRARAGIERAAALARTHLGEGHPLARDVDTERAVLAALAGDTTTGLAGLADIVASVAADDPSTRIDRGLVLTQLGEVLIELDRAEEALPVLREATELLGASWVESTHAARAAKLLAQAQAQA
jgi:tetratricopeptide (TPR) repeat protein/predicted Ser/Thr protein kinase